MTKNLYYRTIYSKKGSIIDAITSFFYSLSFFPRILLEVFIRKNFGERYFRLTGPIIMIIILGSIPYFRQLAASFSYYGGGSRSFWDAITSNITWYLFLVAFAYFSILRKREIIISQSKFNFTKFSLYDGDYHPILKKYVMKREIVNGFEEETVDGRKMETLIEPALFFVIGVILLICAQLIGALILICSIIYSLSYISAWRAGDDFVLDIIDEQISANNFHKSFVEDQTPQDTQGFKTRGEKPNDRGFRSKLADDINFEDENPTWAM